MKKVLSSPIARAIASKKNIDITQIVGTGPSGRIMRADVEAFNPSAQNSSPVTKTPVASVSPVSVAALTMEDKRVKATPLRKGIAKALKTSWEKVAYVNLVNEIDVTELWNFRSNLKNRVMETTGVKLTFLPFIIKATTLAIKKYPIFNAKYDEATEEIVYQKNINIGIAVDTPAGLMVPVIKDADKLSLVELAQEVTRLASACKNGTIKPVEMRGSTYTLTNYGSVDALFGVPVINFPNIAITGIGTIKDKVYVRKNQELKPGKVLYLTTAGDHRWVDGADIGRFAYEIRMSLENPAALTVL